MMVMRSLRLEKFHFLYPVMQTSEFDQVAVLFE